MRSPPHRPAKTTAFVICVQTIDPAVHPAYRAVRWRDGQFRAAMSSSKECRYGPDHEENTFEHSREQNARDGAASKKPTASVTRARAMERGPSKTRASSEAPTTPRPPAP